MARVEASVRLRQLQPHLLPPVRGSAPVLSVIDAHVGIYDQRARPGQVTAQDVARARELAEAVARYVAELEQLGRRRPGTALARTPAGACGVTAKQDEGGAAGAGPSGRPWVLSRDIRRGDHRMRRVMTGDQVARLYNPDPFARPVFRAPVYRTPAGLILLVWLIRVLIRLVRFAFRHPAATTALALLAFLWLNLGWIGVAAIIGWAVLVLLIWRHYWPSGFARWGSGPARGTWRSWVYRRKWEPVMTISDLAPFYRGRTILPVLGKVTATRYVDRVQVRLVSGQSAADFAKKADNLAHAYRALLCRVRTAKSGAVVLEFVRRDALAAVIPAQPIPDRPDLKALPVGRREDGLPWLVRLHGTHVLLAGATGAGKASLLWGLIRAMQPLMRDGPGPGAGGRPETDGTGLRPGHLRHLRALRRPSGRDR